jgi:hypothetical protein
MTTYTNPYTGQTINPSQVGYESLTISTNTTLDWPVNGTSSSNVAANIIEVTATVASLQLRMPPATQVSVGQAIIVRNVGTGGSYAFTVTDNSGNTIVNIPLSASGTNSNTYYIYVTNNSTVNGTWASIAMGIGTSSATAGALAGFGLVAIDQTLNSATNVNQVTSAYTFLGADRGSLYVWTGGAGTLTLPVASTVGDGWYVIVKNDGSGILTIAAQGASTIDITSSSIQIQLAYSAVIATDGTDWFTYALSPTPTFNYTQLYLTVTGGTVTLTSVQAQNVIQEYAGTLTSNCTIILPPTVQLYSFRNITSGAFTLTFSTGVVGGTTVTLPQGQTIIAICDGTNVYNAQTSTISSISSLTLGNGSAVSPSLNFASSVNTGLYLAASGQLGFTLSGVAAGQLTSSAGLLLPVGISSGAF